MDNVAIFGDEVVAPVAAETAFHQVLESTIKEQPEQESTLNLQQIGLEESGEQNGY